MDELGDVPTAALRELLAAYGDVPTQRIVAALLVKQGCSKATVAEALDVSLKTVYNWLDRFAERPVEEAPFDEPRPGAPGKLEDDEQAELFETLARDPAAAGYDATAWTPALVAALVSDEYGVEYTRRHVRRLMREAGVR